MKNWTIIRERYLRDELPTRLGGLAANLARIKSFSDHPDHCNIVEDLINESKFFIEWTAANTNVNMAAELIKLQIQLALWQYNWSEIKKNL